MIRLIKILLATAFLCIAAASASSICDNAPCENAINISTGENFTISLESNTGSTGFNWWAQFDTEYLDLLGSSVQTPATSPGMVGVPGEQLFTFNAKNAGNTDVILLYLQPWENGTIGTRKIFPVNIE
jgi:inhibitor of cysteine peptidase